MTLARNDWEILNATADDWENLEQIYHLVCFEFSSENYENGGYYLRSIRGAPLLDEIADRIEKLVQAGLLEVQRDGSTADKSYVWRAWFRMTSEGKRLWETSEYTALAEKEG